MCYFAHEMHFIILIIWSYISSMCCFAHEMHFLFLIIWSHISNIHTCLMCSRKSESDIPMSINAHNIFINLHVPVFLLSMVYVLYSTHTQCFLGLLSNYIDLLGIKYHRFLHNFMLDICICCLILKDAEGVFTAVFLIDLLLILLFLCYYIKITLVVHGM